MIFMIPEEDEPISNCILESEPIFNPDSNSDNNNNENNSSSSIQYDNKNNNNSDSNLNSEQYIALPDLTKNNNDKGIRPEHVYDTDARFDLRYLRKDAIKLEPHSSFRNSLAKKGINIKGEIINTGYVENIIAILQNNSEKTYIIEPNKKIAQAIFLPLVKIAKLVLVKNREELRITARGIQSFGSMSRIDVPVNMAEEKIINKREIISIHQSISILPYDQYIVIIERKVKDQVQIFKTKAALCESGKIELVNLHIPAKNHKHIKIPIYNNIGDTIKILERITIGYLTTEVENQLLNTIPDFPQLCRYVDIISQTIYE
ncbi:hypothetical protein G9A89_017847 [Geosiphon pyriformis]|nr:hypothetical protein G9A89_017847 [Geosiphon pyriformis]